MGALTASLVALHVHPAPGWLTISPLSALWIFLAAMVCEYTDSSLGMGYGTTLTPLLLFAGFGPLHIVPAILLSEMLSGILASALHHRDGNIDFLRDAAARKTALLLVSLSGLGALSAVWLAVSIPAFWLNVSVTVIILAMGVIILLTSNRRIAYRAGGIMAVGVVAAFNKGLSGGGYGPLVTSGQVVSGLPARNAIAITSLAESLTCLVGLLAYLALGKRIAWELAVPLTAGAMLSVPMATLTVRRLSEASLRPIVGVATLALGMLALTNILSR